MTSFSPSASGLAVALPESMQVSAPQCLAMLTGILQALLQSCPWHHDEDMQSHSKWLWLFWGQLTRAGYVSHFPHARAGRNSPKGWSEAASGSLFAVSAGAIQHKRTLHPCHPQPPQVHEELL